MSQVRAVPGKPDWRGRAHGGGSSCEVRGQKAGVGETRRRESVLELSEALAKHVERELVGCEAALKAREALSCSCAAAHRKAGSDEATTASEVRKAMKRPA